MQVGFPSCRQLRVSQIRSHLGPGPHHHPPGVRGRGSGVKGHAHRHNPAAPFRPRCHVPTPRSTGPARPEPLAPTVPLRASSAEQQHTHTVSSAAIAIDQLGARQARLGRRRKRKSAWRAVASAESIERAAPSGGLYCACAPLEPGREGGREGGLSISRLAAASAPAQTHLQLKTHLQTHLYLHRENRSL